MTLTEDGPVDDICIGQPDFDRMIFILDVDDVKRHRFVCEDDISSVVQDHLKRERSLHRRLVLSILTLEVNVHPFNDQGSA